MRFRSPLRWVIGAASLTACAASPGAEGPSDSAPAASVVVAVAPAHAASAGATAGEGAVAGGQETGCFAKPVVLADKRDKSGVRQPRVAQPVDEALPRKLAACPAAAEPDECRAAIAKVYFDANRFEDAGPIFRDVALEGPTGGVGPGAAQFYLECLNVLGGEAEPARDACFDEMARQVGPLKARHCATPSKEAKEVCSLLERIEYDLQRLSIEKLVKKADYGDADALALYRQAGDGYMAMFNRRCAFRRPDAKKKPEPPPGWTPESRCDEIVYNAMRAYMAARETALAQAARAALLDPDNRLDKGELGKKARQIDIR